MAKGPGAPRKTHVTLAGQLVDAVKARVAKQREKNGRHQRPTLVEMKSLERDVYQAQMKTVLEQPHRRGSDSQLCSSAFGRFCLANKLRNEIYDAGNSFSELVRRWRAAKGVPTTVGVGVGGSGDGPSEQTVREWESQMFGIERALKAKSPRHLLAVRHLVVDGEELPVEEIKTAIQGLLILARELGWKVNDHPFN